jgi:hypothetical protein
MKCPTCGGEVKVASSDEGTNYFVPSSEIGIVHTRIDELDKRLSEIIGWRDRLEAGCREMLKNQGKPIT